MADTPPPPSEIVRELRMIRQALFGIALIAALWTGPRIGEFLVRPAGPNNAELRDIQAELRLMREELARPRPLPCQQVVIPAKPQPQPQVPKLPGLGEPEKDNTPKRGTAK